MTNEQLCVMYQSGNKEVIGDLYKNNSGLIEKIIRRYKGVEDLDDLRQESYFGLVRAAELWNPEKDVLFMSYAAYWIKQHIVKYIHDHSTTIRVPVHQREVMRAYSKMKNSYQVRFGRDPEEAEICHALDISREQYQQLLKDLRTVNTCSTSVPIGDDEETILEDIIPAEGDPIGDLVEKIHREEMTAEIWSCVDSLPTRQTEVIRSRYKDQKTLKECGEALGVSAEYVRSIESKALRELRKPKFTKRLSPYITDGYIRRVGYRGSISSFRQRGSIEEQIIMTLEEHSGPIWKNKLDDIEKMRKQFRASSHALTQEA